MAEYDALIVFILSAILMIFYISVEAKPKGSNVIGNIKETISRFFNTFCLLSFEPFPQLRLE